LTNAVAILFIKFLQLFGFVKLLLAH